MDYKLDKIWVKTLARLDALEERVGRIELAGNSGETFPEQQHRKAKEAIEGHKPDRAFVDGVEQKTIEND